MNIMKIININYNYIKIIIVERYQNRTEVRSEISGLMKNVKLRRG